MSLNKPKWRVLLPREGKMGGVDIYDGDQYVCQMSHHPAERQMAKDYAARIVACVNACEGVPTEVLEAYTVLEKLREKDTQRDELLAALELAVEQMESDAVGIEYECGCGRSLEELDRLGQLPDAILEARAAIARAKGGAA